MAKQNKPAPPDIKGSAPSPEDKAWLEHAAAESRRAPERIEEAAKYLAGIIAISLSIFVSNPPGNLAGWTATVLTVAASSSQLIPILN